MQPRHDPTRCLCAARVELIRRQAMAPINGMVLKVDVRPAKYVGAPPGQPLIVPGNLDTLHLRSTSTIRICHASAPACQAAATSGETQPIHSEQCQVRGIIRRKLISQWMRNRPLDSRN